MKKTTIYKTHHKISVYNIVTYLFNNITIEIL